MSMYDLTLLQQERASAAAKYFGLFVGDIWFDSQDRVCTHSTFSINVRRWEGVHQIPIPFGETEDFWVAHLGLRDLTNCPPTVLGEFKADNNELTNLVGGPSWVKSNYIVSKNPLTSLDGLPKRVGGRFVLSHDPHLPLLKLLLIQDCKGILLRHPDGMPYTEINTILNRYVGKGWAAMVPCARELIRAGFKGNAQL